MVLEARQIQVSSYDSRDTFWLVACSWDAVGNAPQMAPNSVKELFTDPERWVQSLVDRGGKPIQASLPRGGEYTIIVSYPLKRDISSQRKSRETCLQCQLKTNCSVITVDVLKKSCATVAPPYVFSDFLFEAPTPREPSVGTVEVTLLEDVGYVHFPLKDKGAFFYNVAQSPNTFIRLLNENKCARTTGAASFTVRMGDGAEIRPEDLEIEELDTSDLRDFQIVFQTSCPKGEVNCCVAQGSHRRRRGKHYLKLRSAILCCYSSPTGQDWSPDLPAS